jgi:hypothetical protein
MALLFGCQRPDAIAPNNTAKQTVQPSQRPVSVSGRELLGRVMTKYRSCSTYSDDTTIRFRYRQGGEMFDKVTRLAVKFARPNRLRLAVVSDSDEIHIQANEKLMTSKIKDPATDDFHGQTVERAAAPQLSIADIYEVTEYSEPDRPEHMTSILLGLPVHLSHLQLGLLLSDVTFENVFPADARLEDLAEQEIRGRRCHGIRVAGREDPHGFVFWIDAADDSLRRLEYPTRGLFPGVPVAEKPTDVQLTADFDHIEFAATISADLFAPETNSKSLFVRYFVLPPPPLANPRIGGPIEPFDLRTLPGASERSESWVDKHTVLVWFDDRPASRAALAELERVFRQYTDPDGQVLFRAIWVAPEKNWNVDQMRKLCADWRITIPVVTDPQAVGRDRFGVEHAPTVAILGANRRLQFFQVAHSQRIGEDVRAVLHSLLAGHDVGDSVLKAFAIEIQSFQQRLSAATIARGDVTDQVEATRASASDPKKLKLERLWECQEFKSPGNILVTWEDSRPRILVLDEMREVIELDLLGKVVRRYSLDLRDGESVTYLKAYTDRANRHHYWGSARLGRHVFLWDQAFHRELKYPPDDQPHSGIQDTYVADLDRNDEPEIYVAFADPVGLHQVDLRAKRQWSCRSVPGIGSITKDRAQPGRLLACPDTGLIVPIFVNGEPEKPIAVGERAIHAMTASARDRRRPTEYLAMTYSLDGRLIAVGLGRNLEERWSYGLPAGIYRTQVDSPVSVEMLTEGPLQWLLAGPDSSIHIVDDDGEFFDSFHLGHDVRGLSACHDAGSSVLLVASPATVSAYKVVRAGK